MSHLATEVMVEAMVVVVEDMVVMVTVEATVRVFVLLCVSNNVCIVDRGVSL